MWSAPTLSSSAHTFLSGLLTPRELAFAGDAADTYVPRSGSPSRSLSELACVAGECETESMLAQLSLSRGTVTTTDWGMFTKDELHSLCTETDDQSEAAYLFDSDDRGSVEVICDQCRGIGHFRRVCPSATSPLLPTTLLPPVPLSPPLPLSSPRTRREWAVRLPNLIRNSVRGAAFRAFWLRLFGAMVQQQGSAYGILRGLGERRRVDVGHGTSASVR